MTDFSKNAILSTSRIFAGLNSSDIDRLADMAQVKSFEKDTEIFSAGDDARGFYLIALGRVKIYKISAGGKEHVLHIMGQGEPVGEVAMFSARSYPASAQALEDSVCLYLSRNDFVAMISEDPQLALNLIATLCERLRHFADQVEDLSLKEVSARLARHLLELHGVQRRDRILLSMPKRQLANTLGTVSETLSRTLAKMKTRGVIDVDGREVAILDIGELEELAMGKKL